MKNYIAFDFLNPNAINARYGRPPSACDTPRIVRRFAAASDAEALQHLEELIEAGQLGYSEQNTRRVGAACSALQGVLQTIQRNVELNIHCCAEPGEFVTTLLCQRGILGFGVLMVSIAYETNSATDLANDICMLSQHRRGHTASL